MAAPEGPPARHGWWGRVLRLDLSERRWWVEDLDEDLYRRHPGGRALIAHYLLAELGPGTDPLSPKNRLVFAPGILTGAPLSGASRHSVGAKSPLMGGFGESEVGGFWGAELKRAGWDGIVVIGASPDSVYVWINDDAVEIRDASHLWGSEVMETEEALRAEVGDRLARVCEIGPAGENLVRFAVIANDYKDFAGRTGLGAVMGSKRLKAIVVRGSRTLPLADPALIKQVGRTVADTLQRSYWAQHNYGTGMGLDGYTRIGGLAVNNFDGGVFDGAGEISAEALLEKGYRVKMEACWACSVRCKKVVRLEEPYPVDPKYGGPEFESTVALGPQCGIGDLALIAKANERCNAFGLDTISFGSTLAWSMDCRRSGILPDASFDGEPAEFGNERVLLPAIEAVAHRRGHGDLLAEGSAAAARAIGAGDELLTTVKGLEIAMHDPRQRTEFGRALRMSYATSPGGGDHLGGNRPDKSARDVVGMCFFLKCDDQELADIVNAITGWQVTAQDLMTIAERAITLARLFNLREGFGPDDDRLPPKVLRPHVSGPLSKLTLDPGALREQVVGYYRQRGWTDDGRPTSATLERLGIDALSFRDA